LKIKGFSHEDENLEKLNCLYQLTIRSLRRYGTLFCRLLMFGPPNRRFAVKNDAIALEKFEIK